MQEPRTFCALFVSSICATDRVKNHYATLHSYFFFSKRDQFEVCIFHDIKGPIITYLMEGRSPSRHKGRFCI